MNLFNQELPAIFDVVILSVLLSCLFFVITVVKKHVTFKWWVYRKAIKRSRKREWEAYVDYYNGIEGPEKWQRLLHITELLRRRRDLERWNQWVPEDRSKLPTVIHKVEVRRTERVGNGQVVRDAAYWLRTNTREGISREGMLELLENYAILIDSRLKETHDN